MSQFLHTWFGFGPQLSEGEKSGRVLEVEARLRDRAALDEPYSEAAWRDKPDDNLKTTRMKPTNWVTSRNLEMLWRKADVNEPNDVKILPGDKLAYVDSGDEKLVVCELHDGAEVHSTKPTQTASFKPKSLLVDQDSNIKVYDKEQNTVFTWQGKPPWRDLGRWGQVHRTFGDMRGMCKDGDKIHVVDTMENYVATYRADGTRIRTFGRGRFSRPAFVTCDQLERIHVTDERDCCVHVFDDVGNYVLTFGSAGEANGKLLGPTGICISPAGDVIIADSLNSRISVFAPDGRFKHHLVDTTDTMMRPLGIDLNTEGLLAVTSQYIAFKTVTVYKVC